jgi:hypothetical protein
LLLLEWENEKEIIIGEEDEGMVNVYCIISSNFPTDHQWIHGEKPPIYVSMVSWEKWLLNKHIN